MLRSMLGALVATTTLVAAAPAAHALTVDTSGSTVTIAAAVGEQNSVRIGYDSDGGPCGPTYVGKSTFHPTGFVWACTGLVTITDLNPIRTSTAGCLVASAGTLVQCVGAFSEVRATLGDRIDYFQPDGWLNANVTTEAESRLRYVLDGGADTDWLAGGGKADTITGGAGADTVWGQAGNDTLQLRDGASDEHIECGDGTADVLVADIGDPASTLGCESVQRS